MPKSDFLKYALFLGFIAGFWLVMWLFFFFPSYTATVKIQPYEQVKI